jgi:hypothetical protein
MTKNFYFKFLFETFLELSISSLINLYSFSAANFSYIFDAMVEVVALGVVFLFPPWLLYFFHINHKRFIKDEVFKSNFEALIENLNVHSNFYTLNSFLFLFRRLLFGVTAVCMSALQVNFFSLQTFTLVTYLIYFQPFEKKKDSMIEAFNEGCIAAITFHLFLCSDYVDDDSIKYNIGWSIVVITLLSILINNIILIIDTISTLKQCLIKIKARFSKKDRVQKYSENVG